MTNSKISTIQDIYGAFGRGDVPAILAAFSPRGAVRFNAEKPSAPWQVSRQGHAELPRFFDALAQNVEFSRFEPENFVEGPDSVVARVRLTFKVKVTGRVVDQTQVHWWSFDADEPSKVLDLVHFEDTAQVARAVARP